MTDFAGSHDSKTYFAFVSFSDEDAGMAQSIARFIESFRVPVRLGGSRTQLPRRMSPVFHRRQEVAESADLGARVRVALSKSGALVVLCSPSAARSKWIDEEIRAFRQTGNPRRIFAVLVAGDPETAFPPALAERNLEPLAVDFRRGADTPRDSHLRLAAALLGVDFDSLKRRDAARRRNARLRAAALTAGLMIVLAAGAALYESNHPHVAEFPVPRVNGVTPNSIDALVPSSDGALWFVENLVDRFKIGRFTSRDGFMMLSQTYILSYRDPGMINMGLGAAAAAPDGSLWFSVDGSAPAPTTIYHVTATGRLAAYPLRSGQSVSSFAFDRSRTVWYIADTPEEVGKIAPGGRIVRYAISPSARARCFCPLIVGSGGVLWFVEQFGNAVGRVTAGGRVARYQLPTPQSLPGAIVRAPDGDVWFTEAGTPLHPHVNKIGRITPAGRITEFRIPTPNSGPLGMTVGPDDALWFTEIDADKIGRITMDGTITEYAIPTPESWPESIVAGADGALWFAEYGVNKIGRITTSGRITEYPVGAGSGITTLANGPGGALWFVDARTKAIARMSLGNWLFRRRR